MCGIVGVFGRQNAREAMCKGLNTLQQRGRDGFGVASDENVWFGTSLMNSPDWNSSNLVGHCLHAVVGHVQQPLSGRGRLVANCEIFNWKELAEQVSEQPKNDAELLLLLLDQTEEQDLGDMLSRLRGDYAFAYWRDDDVWIARDLVGVKPVWYAVQNHELAFASERKALFAMGFANPHELNPRQILCYHNQTKALKFIPRNFYSITPVHTTTLAQQVTEILSLLEHSVERRIPAVPFGLLFSGGIDSVILAALLKKLGQNFPCYVVAIDTRAPDMEWSRLAAQKLDLELREIEVSVEETKKALPTIVPLLEEATVMKVGVALPVYFAAQRAAADGFKVLFSGMGADELFAGYYRQTMSTAVNEDCLSAIRGNYERNTYRDDVITMNLGIELRVPYLDPDVVSYALRIPPTHKIREGHMKFILRKAAEQLGITPKLAYRPKKAAQYGSWFDRRLKKLAKENEMTRAEYLRQFLPKPLLRLGTLFSTGKDSSFALHVMQKRNYDVACLITMQSENPDSYMFHTPAVELAHLQAEALGIPIIIGNTEGRKEEELEDLRETLKMARDQHQIGGVITGALYSNYQRQRIEKVCDQIGLKCYSPLWHIDQEQEMRQLLREGFEVVLTAYAAYGLDPTWLGRTLTEKDVDSLVDLNRELGINIAGEGGEFESFVTWMPGFRKRICLQEISIEKTGEWSGKLRIESALLCD
ncbi:MAG: diphthine--ammonia ligase [Candidatus Hodarchaeales archaeon]|jgi:asparagine synthase (glutamine-hydrolysing)